MLVLVSKSKFQPVSLDEAKLHCRPDGDDDDQMLEMYIAAATAHAEAFTGRAFMPQTWDYYTKGFPVSPVTYFQIPKPPLLTLDAFVYYGAVDTETVVPTSTYSLDLASEPARINLVTGQTWPTVVEGINSVRVRFTAGYLDDSSPPASNVPADIKAAILMLTATMFEHREHVLVGQGSSKLAWGAEELLRQHRVHRALA